MTAAYAQFLDALGINPRTATEDPPTIQILDADNVIVTYTATKVVSADRLETAFGHLDSLARKEKTERQSCEWCGHSIVFDDTLNLWATTGTQNTVCNMSQTRARQHKVLR